jgi:Na+-translocating ferredoxin:NAD+ oxidoreductase RnfD subunit
MSTGKRTSKRTSMRTSVSTRWSSVRRYLRTPKGQFGIVLAMLTAVAATAAGWSLVAPGLLGAMAAAVVVDLPLGRLRTGAWVNPDGALLSGWIVALVLSPHEPWLVAAATAVAAIAGKHAFRIGRANVVNPAAFGLVATFYAFDTGQSWWGALPELSTPWLTLLLATGWYTATRVNKLPLVIGFLGTYYALVTASAFLGDPAAVSELYRAPDLHAALFFAFFMLTDPPSSPPRHHDQLPYAIVAAVAAFAVFELIGAAYFLLAGLLVANLWEGWRKRRAKLARRPAAVTT